MAARMPLVIVLSLFAAAACNPVRGSSVRSGPRAAAPTDAKNVRLVALDVPEGAVEVGIIQARGTASIDRLHQEFRNQCAKVGGNLAKVDKVTTDFEMQTMTQTQTYNCGTPQAPSTCSRMVTQNVEVATTQIQGRAFVLERR